MADQQKNMRGRYYPADTPLYDRDEDIILAAASGGLATIGSLAVNEVLYVVADCTDRAVSALEFDVKIDRVWAYRLYRARERNPLKATITLADATIVDAEDTFVLNGVTWTAKAADPVAADHEYLVGASNAATAANLAAALAGDYGPGATARVAAVSATDVITLEGTTAPCLQFAQGASDAAEIAWADLTLTRLVPLAAAVADKPVTNTMDGETIAVANAGWPYAVIAITNGAVGVAATRVGVIRY